MIPLMLLVRHERGTHVVSTERDRVAGGDHLSRNAPGAQVPQGSWPGYVTANLAREDPLAVAGAAGRPGPGKLPSGNPGGTCMANRPVNTGSCGAGVPPDGAPAPGR